MRGATINRFYCWIICCFNSRPSCEGRQINDITKSSDVVSIHAPRARGDTKHPIVNDRGLFQFTPLVRGATKIKRHYAVNRVSIHAPRARGDIFLHLFINSTKFQFTPLVRGATSFLMLILIINSFNSRPSCEGRLPNPFCRRQQ